MLANKNKKNPEAIHLVCNCMSAKVCNTHQKQMEQKHFTIPTKGTEVYMELEQILYLEAKGHYTNVYLKDGTKILSTKTLGYFAINLPQNDFRRCHNTYIINITHITEHFMGRSGYFVMDNKQTIPLASRRKIEFADIIGL